MIPAIPIEVAIPLGALLISWLSVGPVKGTGPVKETRPKPEAGHGTGTPAITGNSVAPFDPHKMAVDYWVLQGYTRRAAKRIVREAAQRRSTKEP